MKTLKESLLADIEDTLKDGDDFMHKEKELHTLYKFKSSHWKNIYNGTKPAISGEQISKVSIYKYVWNCPYVLHMNNTIKDLIDGDGRKIVFILYIEQSKGPFVGKIINPYLDIAVLDEDNRILNVYQQWLKSGYASPSKTDTIKRVSTNYMTHFDETELIEILTSKKPDMLYNYGYMKLISIANLMK
jgi:hypothetical protein